MPVAWICDEWRSGMTEQQLNNVEESYKQQRAALEVTPTPSPLTTAHISDVMALVEESRRLRMELARSYRALYAFYGRSLKKQEPDKAMVAYHCLTIGAAIRLVQDNNLDGSDFFVGKPQDVLAKVLKTGPQP
jgi:hypothetical protein